MEEGKEFMKELLFEIDFGCVWGGGGDSALALMVASSTQAKMLVTWSLTTWESKAQDQNSCSISTDSPYLHRKHIPTGKWGPLK